MTIAELLINIGVKGDGPAKKAFAGVSDSINTVKEMSIEAKAAILGVLYGLQRMMSESSQIGQGLTNYAAFTGMSTKALQQYQYAGLQVGLTNEQMMGTFKNLQRTMSGIDWGQMPEGLREINEALNASGKGAIDAKKKDDIPYLMQKFQQYAQLEKRVGIRNKMLGSMGFDEGLISAFTRGAFNQKTFNQAPIYSDEQSKRLAKINVGFSNIKNNAEHALASIIEKFGPELLEELRVLSGYMLELARFVAEYLTFLKIGKTAKTGWDYLKNPEKLLKTVKNSSAEDIVNAGIDTMTSMFGIKLPHTKELAGKGTGAMDDMVARFKAGEFKPSKVFPPIKPGKPNEKEMSITQNMNVTFQEANEANAKKTVNTMKKELIEAHRNLPKGGR